MRDVLTSNTVRRKFKEQIVSPALSQHRLRMIHWINISALVK